MPTWAEPDVLPGYGRTVERRQASGWSRVWSIGRWVVGGVILVTLVGQFFDSGTTLDSLEIGACFADPGVGLEVSEVETVACEQPHDFEMSATVGLGSADRPFPGTDTLFDELEAECIAGFPDYVGHDYLTSAYDFVAFTPVKDAWDAGDRTGMCALYEFDAAYDLVPSIGTARNAGR